MLFPLTIGFFMDPLWALQDQDSLTVFLMFYAAPWSLGAFLLYRYFTPDQKSSRISEHDCTEA